MKLKDIETESETERYRTPHYHSNHISRVISVSVADSYLDYAI